MSVDRPERVGSDGGRMRKYFADCYHGGVVMMDRWGEKGFHQAPVWEFGTNVPRWLREHVFRRLDSLPDYKVCLEIEAATFEYWQRRDPQLLTEIADRIARGQIEIADGTYAQPYGHILGHESIVRQFLYGQEIVERLTGAKSRTHFKQEHMFVPNMPGLLLAAGYRGVVLRAHIHHFGCCPAVDEQFIYWRGRDGRKIAAVPNYFADRYPYGFQEDTLDECEAYSRARQVRRMLFSQGLDVSHDQQFIHDFLKTGSQGKPFECDELLGQDRLLLSDWPKMGISDEKLRLLRQRGYEPALLSTFIGDCVTTQSRSRQFDADYFRYAFLWGSFGDEVLKEMKRAEASLYAAEATGALLKLNGFEDHDEDGVILERAWKQVLEAQCHDVHVCPSGYSLAVVDFPVRMAARWCRSAIEQAESIAGRNARDLLRHVTEPAPVPMDSTVPGEPGEPSIALFNPLSFRRADPVTIVVELPKGFADGLRLQSQAGEIPFDCLRCRRFPDGSICTAELIFPADVPGFACQSIRITAAPDLPSLERIATRHVNTGAIEAEVTGSGTIAALRRTDDSRDCLATDAFAGNELSADFLAGLVRTGDQPGALTCLQGRYLTEFNAQTMLGKVPVATRLRFYQGSSRIDFRTEIEFEKDTSTGQSGSYMQSDYFGALRVHFNPSFGGAFFSDFPLSIERSTRQVMPGQSFGCLTDGESGVTLINRGNIGYYRNAERGARLSLILASGDGAYRYGPYPLSGKMTFEYSLIPHRGDWVTAGSVLRAAEVRTPIRAATVFGHRSSTAMGEPFLRLTHERVLATALFEYHGVMFLRLWNSLPEPTETEMTCAFPVGRVWATDIFGEGGETIQADEGRFVMAFAPFELRTMRITP